MAGHVEYVPDKRVLDFGSLSPDDYALVVSLHGVIHRGDQILKCLEPGGHNSFMQVKRSPLGNYFGAHYAGDAHGVHVAEPETLEHRRQKDYWQQAAEDVGLTAVTELPVPGGKLDVAITGGKVATDVEVQHTAIAQATVTRRTRTYARAGFLPVWFNDASGARPTWLRTVPFMGSSVTDWTSAMPKPRTVKATGLGYLRELRCEVGTFGGGCPQTRRRYACGEMHPAITGGRNAPVEDVAEMIAGAELVPLRDWYGNVFLVRAGDLRRWQEMTGGLGRWTADGRAAASGMRFGPLRAGRCVNPVHDQDAVIGRPSFADSLTARRRLVVPGQCDTPGCGQDARLYPGGWRCEEHKPRPRAPIA